MTALSGRRVLVTGGCGFVGANLVPLLLARGAEVRVLDDLSRGFREYLDGLDLRLVVGDIRDPQAVAEAAEGCDTVVHLAAYGSVVESISDPETNFDVNARGTLTVLEGARQAGASRFVMASTGGAIMGDTPPPVSEASVPRPISPYGASKLCGEAYCCAYAGSYGMRTVMLRFGNVYGPMSAHKKGVITLWAKALLRDEPFVIYGDGSASRDFLHVSDLCDGALRAAAADVPPASVFHLSSGRETTVGRIAELMREIAGKPDHPVERRPRRVGEVDRNFAAYDLARDVLGFEPTHDLRRGLEEFWAWALDRREHVLATELTDS